jgi:hypothetical protein
MENTIEIDNSGTFTVTPAPLALGSHCMCQIDRPDYRSKGELRPCVIVKVWNNEYGDKPGYNVIAFVDGSNDFPTSEHTIWLTSVKELSPGVVGFPYPQS